MNQKDKAPTNIPEGELELDEPEETVRLSVGDEESETEMALRRAKQAMGAEGLASQFLPPHLENVGGGAPLEGASPEDGWEERVAEKRKLPIGYVALGAVTLLALVVWGVLMMTQGEKAVGIEVAGLSRQLDDELEEHREASELMERIESVARNYLSAETVAEKSRYVRHRERVTPLMEDYYQDHPLEPREFIRVLNLSPLGIEKRSFMVISAATVGQSGEEAPISVVAEQVSDGELFIDWESEVAYQPMSIDDFISTKPAEAVDFRVYLAEDHFYNLEFADSGRYLSLKLTDKNSEGFLFGFVERDSGVHRSVIDLLEKSVVGKEPAIVRVRFLPGSESRRSVLVEEIVAPRWIHVDDPDAPAP